MARTTAVWLNPNIPSEMVLEGEPPLLDTNVDHPDDDDNPDRRRKRSKQPPSDHERKKKVKAKAKAKARRHIIADDDDDEEGGEDDSDEKPPAKPDERSLELMAIEDKKPDEKKNAEQRKPDEKKADQRKPDEKKALQRKPDEKKAEQRKPDEKKAEQRKPDEKKPGKNGVAKAKAGVRDQSKNKKFVEIFADLADDIQKHYNGLSRSDKTEFVHAAVQREEGRLKIDSSAMYRLLAIREEQQKGKQGMKGYGFEDHGER